MNKFIFFAIMFILVAMASKTFAGPVYNITFHNETDKIVVISPAEKSHWFVRDFGKKWVLAPNSKKALNTLSNQGKNDGTVAVKLSSNGKVFARVAIWFGKNKKQNTNCNVSRSSCFKYEYIGTNNSGVKTDLSTDSSKGAAGTITGNVYITNSSLK